MGEQTGRSFICLGGPLRYATPSSECYATDAARTPSASGATVFAARFVNKPANPCIDNRPSQNLSGAYVHVPGFWCGPELDRFVWDKDCGGIVNEGRTQNLPAVLTAHLQAETPSLRMGSGGLPQVVEFKTPRSIVAAGPYSAYD